MVVVVAYSVTVEVLVCCTVMETVLVFVSVRVFVSVAIGVTVMVSVTLMVPGDRVLVVVLETDGVGIDKQKQAVETYADGQAAGICFGFSNLAPRFPAAPMGGGIAGALVYALSRQVRVTVELVDTVVKSVWTGQKHFQQ